MALMREGHFQVIKRSQVGEGTKFPKKSKCREVGTTIFWNFATSFIHVCASCERKWDFVRFFGKFLYCVGGNAEIFSHVSFT